MTQNSTPIDKEIEIKISLEKDQLEILKNWLKENAEYKGEFHQVDQYFNNPKDSFFKINKKGLKDARIFFRVRRADNKNTTCLKYFHYEPENPSRTSHCDEYETKIENPEVITQMYEKLGFEKDIIIDKKRRIYHYKEIEIAMDQVKNLGDFVELELKEQVKNVKAAKGELYELLKEIGITKYRVQEKGYVTMMWNPGHDFTEKEKADL